MRLTVGEAQESLAGIVNGQLGIYSSPYRSANSENFDNGPQCYFETLGTISSIVHNIDRPPWYKAAPDAQTNAKVIEDGRGSWMWHWSGLLHVLQTGRGARSGLRHRHDRTATGGCQSPSRLPP